MLTTGKNSSSGLLTNNLFKGSYWKLAFTNYELSGAKGACELIIVGPLSWRQYRDYHEN